MASSGRHQPGEDRPVGADLRVHIGLDPRDLLGAERLGMREVETQPVRRHQASLLGDMGAQALPQRGMEKMRGAVIGADPVAPRGIDREVHIVADREAALLDHAPDGRGGGPAAWRYPAR
jgi:hypothetical protein